MHLQASRDILRIADPWAADLTPLEMQNAETKRVASSCGSRRLEMSEVGIQLVPMRDGKLGPERLIKTKGCSTTMAISTLRHLISAQKLRRGDGPDGVILPDSRRSERLFGHQGRTSYRSSGVKLEHLEEDYDPLEDTCIKAFVRFIALAATAAAAEAAALAPAAAEASTYAPPPPPAAAAAHVCTRPRRTPT